MRELIGKHMMVKNRLYAALSTQSSTKHDYEEAIRLLNSLQSNAALLQSFKISGKRSIRDEAANVTDTKKYLARIGVSMEQLDTLPVIHITGTKGKGSTCAFCESILRHNGFKTGFFSSPHLISVTERIRINGLPIKQQDFSKYVTNAYKELDAKKEYEGDMPPYFKFLTIVAFQAFLAEKVDVAIVEVGIGGEYDCTNVLRKVQAVGITSLGIDHTSLLGNTIEEIAWQKAGIMKPGSVAFTVDNQPEGALKVLRSRSLERQCPLLIAPPLGSYDWGQFSPELGISSDVQKGNASLALQLTSAWMRHYQVIASTVEARGDAFNESANSFAISEATANGLKYCRWPGRTQVLKCEGVNYFMDGAHTVESLRVCFDWFQVKSQECDRNAKRALIFNSTGDRNSTKLLEILWEIKFDLVIFCPNLMTTKVDNSSDLANFMNPLEQQSVRCRKHREIWLKLYKDRAAGDVDPDSVKQLSCVSAALDVVRTEARRYNVLVTGSLHLVGAVLSVIDPQLNATIHEHNIAPSNNISRTRKC